MVEAVKLCKLSMLISKVEDIEAELKFEHATNSYFRNMVSYNNYRPLDKLQSYNWKIAASKGNFAKQMKTQIKTKEFGIENPIKIPQFKAKLKSVCN